jgi:hypothetical protein
MRAHGDDRPPTGTAANRREAVMESLDAAGSSCGWTASQEPSTFAEADEGPMVLSVAETKQVVAIQDAANLDPDAYVEACRAKGR